MGGYNPQSQTLNSEPRTPNPNFSPLSPDRRVQGAPRLINPWKLIHPALALGHDFISPRLEKRHERLFQGLGFRVQGSGLGFQKVWGLRFWVLGSGLGVQRVRSEPFSTRKALRAPASCDVQFWIFSILG